MLEIAAPLRQVTRNEPLVASMSEGERARWRTVTSHLATYGDDDLFADLVADTLARLDACVARERRGAP
jgi:hypothetical protein